MTKTNKNKAKQKSKKQNLIKMTKEQLKLNYNEI